MLILGSQVSEKWLPRGNFCEIRHRLPQILLAVLVVWLVIRLVFFRLIHLIIVSAKRILPQKLRHPFHVAPSDGQFQGFESFFVGIIFYNFDHFLPVYLPLVVNEASHPLPGFIWNRQFLFLLEWRLDRSCTGHSRYVPALINFQDVPHLMG